MFEIDIRCGLHNLHRGLLIRIHGRRVTGRGQRAARWRRCGFGDIRHVTRIQIGLRDRIARRADHDLTRIERRIVIALSRDITAHGRDLVIADDQVCHQYIAGIGHSIVISQHITDSRKACFISGFHKGQFGLLIRIHSFCRCGRVQRAACWRPCGFGIVSDKARVQIRLGDGVCPRTDDSLARI